MNSKIVFNVDEKKTSAGVLNTLNIENYLKLKK